MRWFLPALAILAFAPGLAQAKKFDASKYDVTIRMEKGGRLDVTENFIFRFQGGPFTQAFRDIPAKETEGLQFVEALLDGRTCSQGTGPGQVEISGTSPMKVRWHFAPTTDAEHTMTLRYRVAGAMRRTESGDTLLWNALPTQRKYRISTSTIRLEYPSTATPQFLDIRRFDEEFAKDNGTAVATLTGVREKGAQITAHFALGTFLDGPPAWQQSATERKDLFRDGALMGAAAGLGILLIGVVWLLQSSGDRVEQPAVGVMTEPPANSLEIGTRLTGHSHGAMAMMLALANRGVLQVEDTGKTWTGQKMRVIKTRSVQRLSHVEQLFLEKGFKESSEATLDEFSSRITSGWSGISKLIQDELRKAGMIDEQKEARQKGLWLASGLSAVVAAVLLILAVVLHQSAQPYASGLCTVAGGGALVLSLVALVVASSTRIWTLRGEEAAARWRSFAEHIKDVSKEKAFVSAGDWQRLLPYAVAFGVGTAWAKRMSQSGGGGLPAWFRAASDSGDASFLALIAVTSASSSSGASAGASAGGGGGASGAS